METENGFSLPVLSPLVMVLERSQRQLFPSLVMWAGYPLLALQLVGLPLEMKRTHPFEREHRQWAKGIDFVASLVLDWGTVLEDFQQELVDSPVRMNDFDFFSSLYWEMESDFVLSFLQHLGTVLEDFHQEPIDLPAMPIGYGFLHSETENDFVPSLVPYWGRMPDRFHVQLVD